MLFLILQQRNWLESRLQQLFTRKLPDSVQLDQLELTAIIDFQNSSEEINSNLDSYLEKAWSLTQNDYPESSEPIQWRKESRSTDVCDVIQLEDHRVFMIDSSGFKQLYQDPIIHVAYSVEQPHGEIVDVFDTLTHRWEKDQVIEEIRLGFYYTQFCERFDIPGETYLRLRCFK